MNYDILLGSWFFKFPKNIPITYSISTIDHNHVSWKFFLIRPTLAKSNDGGFSLCKFTDSEILYFNEPEPEPESKLERCSNNYNK